MTYMSYTIVLARIMTTLGLEFEKAMHYHDEGYKSDNKPMNFLKNRTISNSRDKLSPVHNMASLGLKKMEYIMESSRIF